MARAFVELIGSASYTINKRKFLKNSPQVLTDPDEILFFQNRPGFKVDIMQDAPRVIEKKKAEVKHLEKELKTIIEKPKKKVKKEKEVEAKPKHTKEDLLALKKVDLSALAKKMGIVFDTPTKRLKMIDKILKKQEG